MNSHFDISNRELKNRAVTGAAWTMAGYGASQVLRLISNLILARMLFPAAFGLMALVNVFMQGLQMFSDMGIGPAIIQNPRGHEPLFLRTSWTIQVLRGCGLWLICILMAYPTSRFFAANDPAAGQLLWLLPITGFTAFIGGFNSTSLFTLNRKMDMARITVLDLIPQLISLAVTIGWAWMHRSVWALVAGGLAFSLARMALSHHMNPGERDGFAWDKETLHDLARFGSWIFLSTIVSFLATHLDRLMLGRMLTLTELGLYSIGLTLARVAIQTSTRLSSNVMYPVISRYQERPERLMELCLKGRHIVLWAGGAVCAAFAIFSPAFFHLLYDARYTEAGTISRWLALYTWSTILVSSIDRIPLALGKARALLIANIISTCGMGLAVVGYTLGQLPGFIIGMACGNGCALIYLVTRLPFQRRAVLIQSGVFSAILFLYTLSAIGLLFTAKTTMPEWGLLLLYMALAAVPCLAATWTIYRFLKQRRRV
ncbi:MAG: polysaccharide biosynthesis protein [Spartobacteria bacterium]|nr:polysaccharide biosynthesis protein [Spartobacteria bacterium]